MEDEDGLLLWRIKLGVFISVSPSYRAGVAGQVERKPVVTGKPSQWHQRASATGIHSDF
jgi:hypothetical protein